MSGGIKETGEEKSVGTEVIKNINISTTTVIVTTNLELELDWLINVIDITEFDCIYSFKTTKEFQEYIIRQKPPFGTITMVQHKEKLRGFKIKKKKTKFFRNALSLVMYVGKLVTVKIPKKGKLQLTGCITEEHTEECIKQLWNILKKHPQSTDTYYLTDNTNIFKTIIRTVMTDIVFNIGFDINRQKLDRFMNRHTDFNSLLETSFGYTGVNIKIPFHIDPEKYNVKLLWYDESTSEGWHSKYISYNEYIHTLNSRDRQKELNKSRKNTFLVFHSGTAIMSGMTIEYMKEIYTKFYSMLIRARSEIEEKLTDD